jgi:hypothetical protein
MITGGIPVSAGRIEVNDGAEISLCPQSGDHLMGEASFNIFNLICGIEDRERSEVLIERLELDEQRNKPGNRPEARLHARAGRRPPG